jgi:hypothetical protein
MLATTLITSATTNRSTCLSDSKRRA